MKVLWVHNYNRKSSLSGVNMHELVAPLKQAGIELVTYDMGMDSRELVCSRHALGMLRAAAQGFDIVHAQYGSGCGWVVSKLGHPCKVLSLKGSDLHGPIVPWGRRKLLGWVARTLSLCSLKKYRHIIVMSERMKKDVARHAPHIPVSVLADGIDTDHFGKHNKSEARRQLGGTEEERWVLFVCISTQDVVKRYPLALKAMEELRKRMPQARLISLTNIPRELVPVYFSASDVVLLTSSHEGWPNCIKESLASGRPFVATDVGDLRQFAEKTKTCKITGDHPQDIAQALYDVLTSPLKDDNLPALVAPFDKRCYVPRLVEIYDAVLKNKL